MSDSGYEIIYTKQFWEDISEAIRYIVTVLKNPLAAQKLKDDTEAAIIRQSASPESIKPFFTDEEPGDVYYAVTIRNFIAFYVVNGGKMEFRRFLYSKRNLSERIP